MTPPHKQNPNGPPYRCHSFVVSRFGLDGGAMFGVVPRPMWERHFPPDANNRIPMVTRILVLSDPTSANIIVIDAGMGDGWSDREAARYNIDLQVPTVAEALASIHIPPKAVTIGIMTHLHFDHAGGWTRSQGERRVPLFPNATHLVQGEHLAAATRPTARDRASFITGHVAPLAEKGLLKRLERGDPIAPGISVMVCNGHTFGMQVPIISGPTHTLVYPSDLIPTAAHVQPPWIMAYDLQPLVSIEEKTRLLDQAALEGWIIVLEHDPAHAAVTVSKAQRGYDVTPVEIPTVL